jgi:hypothetical protein
VRLVAFGGPKISSPDPALLAVSTPYPSGPLLTLFDPPIKAASWRPRSHLDLDGWINFTVPREWYPPALVGGPRADQQNCRLGPALQATRAASRTRLVVPPAVSDYQADDEHNSGDDCDGDHEQYSPTCESHDVSLDQSR